MEQRNNLEVFRFGERKLIARGPRGRETITTPAIEIQVWAQANSWHWSLIAATRTGGLYTTSVGLIENASTREQAALKACGALVQYSKQPLYTANQARLPKGWEHWLFITFGDASPQLALFAQDGPGQLPLF